MKTQIDIAFLNITKWLLLFVMSISILSAIGFAIFSGISYLDSRPKDVDVNIQLSVPQEKEDFITELLRQQNERPPERPDDPSGEAISPNLRYTPQATRVIRCIEEFRRKTGEMALTQDEARSFRNELERSMEQYSDYGDYGGRFVDAFVSFTCELLADLRMVRLGTEGRLPPIIGPALVYFESSWEVSVERRNRALAEESNRALEAKTRAITLISASGISLASFVLLAFYLMFARMESNLRGVSAEIRALRSKRE
jgi:hypothetical protein